MSAETRKTQIIEESPALTNEEFIRRYAGPGRIGLVGGDALVDRTIRSAQRHITPDGRKSHWSHAFLYTGERFDGHHWVLESDLEIHHKQIRLGVQENRSTKYFDAASYPNIAILDFHLADADIKAVMTEALDLLAGHSRYSVRELVGTLLALRRPGLRVRENLLAREGAVYCSALVQHCYRRANLDFTPGVMTKNTTPEDISGTQIAHTAFRLIRHPVEAPKERKNLLKRAKAALKTRGLSTLPQTT